MDIIENGIEIIINDLRKSGISFRNKEVLITGGAGFLGSWLCDVLIHQGARVVCLDNFTSGLPENVAHLDGNKNFTLVNHDISKPIYFENNNFDIVMHFASRASPFEFEHYPIQILKANTLGNWNALGIAKEHNARYLFSSTSEAYGDPDPKFVPTPETYNGNVNPVGPRGCYDESKRAGEAFVMAYHLQHKMDTRIVRIFNTYGPRMRSEGIYGRALPRFVEQAINGEDITVFGDGSQTRSFTYVTDEVEGILKLVASDKVNGELVNIGNDKQFSILELAKMILKKTGSDSKIIYESLPKDDPKMRSPDITKARRLLGWEPKVPLEEGLDNYIGWFEEKEKFKPSVIK